MLSVFSYLITMIAILFWAFRVVVVLCTTTGTNFIIQSLNPTIEIILSFTTLICFVLILKRKLSGALIYLITYIAYFGVNAYNSIILLTTSENITANYLSIGCSALGVLIAFFTFLDVGINNSRKGSNTDKKTDWFYKNKEFDREFDDRADRNQYKF